MVYLLIIKMESKICPNCSKPMVLVSSKVNDDSIGSGTSGSFDTGVQTTYYECKECSIKY